MTTQIVEAEPESESAEVDWADVLGPGTDFEAEEDTQPDVTLPMKPRPEPQPVWWGRLKEVEP